MAESIATAPPEHRRIVDAILAQVGAELIFLFGSRARGDARKDSDYDVMLVLPDGADVSHERGAAVRALWAIGLPVDVLARSAADYQRWQHDPGLLDWLVSREGLLLHTSGKVPRRSPRPARVREEPGEGLRMWMERAEKDFAAAAQLLAAADPIRDAICFHSHACVEKLLKAVIVKRGTHPEHTHKLLSLLPADLRADTAVLAACTTLEELYPGSRYPELPMPTLAQARAAFGAAQLMRDRLLPLLTAAA
jgi:HEPN domain-containing protein/predicted nucleotidyltransferase